MAAMLLPTPARAVSGGRPAAAGEPKVTTRTTAARTMPILSEEPPGDGRVAGALPGQRYGSERQVERNIPGPRE
ncbi:hypothetical protein GCM10010300_41610 [Streptomyces olivaceoviridis]|nr:hypothetical protein GCM10010300_41610 [Streptomyces olivaceoviridis]